MYPIYPRPQIDKYRKYLLICNISLRMFRPMYLSSRFCGDVCRCICRRGGWFGQCGFCCSCRVFGRTFHNGEMVDFVNPTRWRKINGKVRKLNTDNGFQSILRFYFKTSTEWLFFLKFSMEENRIVENEMKGERDHKKERQKRKKYLQLL